MCLFVSRGLLETFQTRELVIGFKKWSCLVNASKVKPPANIKEKNIIRPTDLPAKVSSVA